MIHLSLKVNNNKNSNSEREERVKERGEGEARFLREVLVSSLILLTGKQKHQTRKMSPRTLR